MSNREVGSENHELFAVRDTDGTPRVDCPARGRTILFSECQCCERGTVVRVKGARLPFMLCPSEGQRKGLKVGAPDAPVRALMRPAVIVEAASPVAELISAIIDNDGCAALVTDVDGRAAGIVTRSEIVIGNHGWTDVRDALLSMKATLGKNDFESEDDFLLHDFLHARAVGELMTRDFAYVTGDAPISTAADILVRTGLRQLPVLDARSRPLGMLDALDVARWASAPL
jgi:CBS domain-containing protein